MTKWIIDTDAGVDDAIALILGIGAGLDIIAITTVTGNTQESNVYRNVCEILRVCNKSIPVIHGAQRPIIDKAKHDFYFKEDGLNNYWSSHSPSYCPESSNEKAANAIIRLSEENENVGIICLGPLTNLALAFLINEDLKLSSINIMGGTIDGIGNVTSLAEFNIHFDPEAAYIVFERAKHLTITPWETADDKSLIFTPELYESIAGHNEKGKFFRDVVSNKDYLCDAITVACSLDPRLILESEDRHVAVELGGNYSRGHTVVHRDKNSIQNEGLKKFTLIRKVDSEQIFGILRRAMESE